MNRALVVAVIILAACSKKSSGPAKPEDCTKNITAAWTAATGNEIAHQNELHAGADKAKLDAVAAEFTKAQNATRDAIIKLCVDDKWPASVVTCYAGAVSLSVIDRCNSELTKDQRAHFDAALDAH